MPFNDMVLVIDKLLPEGETTIVAAAPKVGKSGIALNAAKAIATGEDFLGVFPVRKGRCVSVQTVIPAWAMAERLKLMGDLPEGMLIHTPGKFKLNLWEEDGYQKKLETGNRERVAGLIEALRAPAASLVIFDPLRHFHSLTLVREYPAVFARKPPPSATSKQSATLPQPVTLAAVTQRPVSRLWSVLRTQLRGGNLDSLR